MKALRWSCSFALLSLFLLASQCGDSEGSSNAITAEDLCAKINARTAACGGPGRTPDRCASTMEMLHCAAAPAAIPIYTDCRGNTVCSEEAGEDACSGKAAFAIDQNAVESCLAKAKACESIARWHDDLCLYPMYRDDFKKTMSDCLALTTCAEQKTCVADLGKAMQATCKT